MVTPAMPEGQQSSRAGEQQSRRRAAEHAGRDIGSRQESMAASELEVMQQLERGA